MNTMKSLMLYVAATCLLFIDLLLMWYGGVYAVQMFMFLILPILIVSAILVLICVLLWKKPVQLSKDDIFFFVAYNASIPYSILSVILLLIMLFRMIP